MRDTKRAGELLGSMEEAVHRLVTDAPGHPWGGGPGHNEARRGEILEAARGLAELAGYTGIALGGGVILAGDGDERVEGELLGIAGAAWRIRGEPDREAGQDWEGFREEQGAVREAILECHDRIRRATGCGDGDRAAEAIGEEVPGETDDLHAPELDGRRTE